MFKHILLPVDLNDETSWRKTLPSAIDLCRMYGATLHLMTVVPDIGFYASASQYLPADYEEKVRAQTHDELHAFSARRIPADIKVQHILAHGTIYKEILEAAERVKADLVIMAAHRPELEDYLLGPNAARVVRHARCSVTVVRE